MWVQSLGWKDPLEEVTATHFSILAQRIPWTEEPGGLQSMQLQRIGHNSAINATTAWVYSWVLYSVPLIHRSVFVLIACCFDYYSFVALFEILKDYGRHQNLDPKVKLCAGLYEFLNGQGNFSKLQLPAFILSKFIFSLSQTLSYLSLSLDY